MDKTSFAPLRIFLGGQIIGVWTQWIHRFTGLKFFFFIQLRVEMRYDERKNAPEYIKKR